jgi:hypothetical protein
VYRDYIKIRFATIPARQMMPDTSGDGTRNSVPSGKGPALRFGRHRVALPASRVLRVMLGVGFCTGGVFAFLPVLGLWMLPVGILVLSVDLPPVRRARRRFDVKWGRSRMRGRTDRGIAWVRGNLRRK